jgi:putative membrane protein
MAFIMGIYEELLAAIKSFNVQTVRLLFRFRFREFFSVVPWRFLLALGGGIGAAVFSLAHLVSWLLEHQTVLLFSFFFGLILASILAIGFTIRWSPPRIVSVVGGTFFAWWIVGLVPLSMPHDPLTLFLSGMTAIMAMILPGISGSFILLILGQYEHILNAVKALDIMTILPTALGAVVGIAGFVRVLSWLLKRWHQVTVAALVGFMIGSLRRIWPWKQTMETMVDRHGEVVPLLQRNILPDFSSAQFWIAVVLCIAGFVVVSLLDHAQSRANPLFCLFKQRSRDKDIAAAE